MNPKQPDFTDADLREWWEERLAIMTADGGLNEHQARMILLRLLEDRRRQKQLL